MNFSKSLKAITILSMLVAIPVSGCAEDSSRGRDRKQGPPPEAIQACEGKQEGDIVSFTGGRGESVKATCQTVEDQLVAVPEGHDTRQ
jgi:hypothetical protein